jgi:hypothetical protein
VRWSAIRAEREEDSVPWQAPQFTEIDMNAEIGAYQRDPLETEHGPVPPYRPARRSDETRSSGGPPKAEQDAASQRR